MMAIIIHADAESRGSVMGIRFILNPNVLFSLACADIFRQKHSSLNPKPTESLIEVQTSSFGIAHIQGLLSKNRGFRN